MNRRSSNIAQVIGLILIVLIGAWDMDAMRAHIARHSWTTLALVATYLFVHVSNYLTVGRLIHRIDALVFAANDPIASPVLSFEERHPLTRAAQTAA
jgi:uncharacterized membrane protein YgdD (TMEM256/DUF423 family)